jgi:ParB-like chromosome segregation protein Spo0J
MAQSLLRSMSYESVHRIFPDPRNPRRHSRAQIEVLAKSIKSFGFNAPIIVDRRGQVIAGHARLEAAKLLGLKKVPIIRLDDISESAAQAYVIADNQIASLATWDDKRLAVHLQELSQMALEFSIEAIGFEVPEIDLRIQSLGDATESTAHDEFDMARGPAISRDGDLWLLDKHRLYCGTALAAASYRVLMDGASASAVFTDAPYNVKIRGHVSGWARASTANSSRLPER